MNKSKRRLASAAILLACSAGMVTACGSDDDKASDTTSAGSPETTAATDTTDGGGTGGEGASAELCDSYTSLSVAFGGGEEPDPEKLGPLLDTFEAEAPEELADAAGVMIAAANKVIESGGEDFSGFEAPEFAEAQGQIDPYVFENCEFDTTGEVTAKEYEFEGFPEEVEAGTAAFLLTNQGDEAHELAIMRKKDGVTQSWDEILSMGEEEGQKMVEEVGGTFVPTKGSTGLAIVDLEAGEYVATCFVPTGTKIDDEGEHEGDGPPHMVQGMVTEFTVS